MARPRPDEHDKGLSLSLIDPLKGFLRRAHQKAKAPVYPCQGFLNLWCSVSIHQWWIRSPMGVRRGFPNTEELVRLHPHGHRLRGRFGSSKGHWHSPSRQCSQRGRRCGIHCAPGVELFLSLVPAQTGRIGDPSKLSLPISPLSTRPEMSQRHPIQSHESFAVRRLQRPPPEDQGTSSTDHCDEPLRGNQIR